MRERGEALSPAALNALYGGLVRDYFGPDLAQDAEYALEWARIPHFYRPFYVYKYATGYSDRRGPVRGDPQRRRTGCAPLP